MALRTGLVLALLCNALSFVSAIQKRSDDNTYETLDVLVQQQASTIQALQARLTSLENKLTTHLNNKVFFTAQLQPGTYTVAAPIMFDNVIVNEGSGYSASTGRFTAPVSGAYVFHANLMNLQNRPSFHWGIQMSTGAWLCRSFLAAENHYDKGTCTATVKLTAGQNVYVQKNEGGTEIIEGNDISSFSGFLLYT